MILYVTRHGETDYNVHGRYSGSTDIPLNENGINQAHQLAEKIKDIPFDIIISSSLIRAMQTAEIVNAVLNLPVIANEKLVERNVGVYEGLTREECQSKYPELWNRRCTSQLDDAPDNGETIRQAYDRVTSALREIENIYFDKTILLICHGFVSRVINKYYKNLSFDEMQSFTLDNCNVVKYTV